MTEHEDDLGRPDLADTPIQDGHPALDDPSILDEHPDIDDLDDEPGSGLLGAHLRELLAPGADLGRQTTHHVDRTLRARSALSTGLDLFGLGWHTIRTVLTDEPTGADEESEGT